MNSESTSMQSTESGIFLRPTPGTPLMGRRSYKPAPPVQSENRRLPHRLPFWRPTDDA